MTGNFLVDADAAASESDDDDDDDDDVALPLHVECHSLGRRQYQVTMVPEMAMYHCVLMATGGGREQGV